MAMSSSQDDFSLLLNKWISEDKELCISIIYKDSPEVSKRCMSIVIGKLAHLDEEVLVIKDDRGNTAMVRYCDCQFIYQSEFTGPAEDIWLAAS